MSAPDGLRWDAVVVGAGFAGSLVAKRLGDQGWRVLVLEAGHGASSPEGLIWTRSRHTVRRGSRCPTRPTGKAPRRRRLICPTLTGTSCRTVRSRTAAATCGPTVAPVSPGPDSRLGCTLRTSAPGTSDTGATGRSGMTT
ncbi:NAD(P)-binding protein [Streptomyces sp. M10(2022)]